MDDMTEEARSGRDGVADLEQRLRKRIHDLADSVQAKETQAMAKIIELEGWRREHTMESSLRGEAIHKRFDATDEHLEKQDEAMTAVQRTVNRWGGGIAAVVAAAAIVVSLVELLGKKP